MKKCPFCGAEIEDTARFCLYCMQSLAEKEQIPPHKKKQPQWLVAVAAVALLVILVMLLLSKAPETSSKDPELHSTAPQHTNIPTSVHTEPSAPRDTEPPIPPETDPETETTVPPVQNPNPSPTPNPEPTLTTNPDPTPNPEPTPIPTPTPNPTPVPEPEQTTQPHTHDYSVKNTSAEYLKQAASCTSAARYYYSCACGAKGDDTFFYGTAAGHTEVVSPGYAADCTNPGLTEAVHCSVCLDNYRPHMEIPALGHSFNVDDSAPQCLACGEKGQLVVQTSGFPFLLSNDIRIDSCTYAVKPSLEETWEVNFSFGYTNLSSNTVFLGPKLTVFLVGEGYGKVVYCSYESAEPNKSGTFQGYVRVPNSEEVITIKLEN